jgi:hypothetical protein
MIVDCACGGMPQEDLQEDRVVWLKEGICESLQGPISWIGLAAQLATSRILLHHLLTS